MFRDVIVPRCDIWVAVEAGVVVGYMALDGSYLDRLYVDPAQQRRGFGLALLNHAMRSRPSGLELHTHQANQRARAFYERHGFKIVRFGVSAPPESAPDVEYRWRPRQYDLSRSVAVIGARCDPGDWLSHRPAPLPPAPAPAARCVRS